MSQQQPPARPAEPPRFCKRCSGKPVAPGAPAAEPLTEWHCPNPQCIWAVCLGCRGITDVSGLLRGRGDQKK